MRSVWSTARSIPLWMWVIITVVLLSLIQTLMPWIEPNPVIYTNLPFPVESPVKVGDTLTLHVTRCTDRLIREPIDFAYARVLHNVDGGKDYTLTDGSGVALPGCIDTINSTVVLPHDMLPGRYQLVGVVRSQGAFAVHKTVYQSAVFEVVL